MALDCKRRLEPFGKTLNDAASHYIQWLKARQATEESRTISDLADEWYEAKGNNKRKPLAADTLKELEKMSKKLKEADPRNREGSCRGLS